MPDISVDKEFNISRWCQCGLEASVGAGREEIKTARSREAASA